MRLQLWVELSTELFPRFLTSGRLADAMKRSTGRGDENAGSGGVDRKSAEEEIDRRRKLEDFFGMKIEVFLSPPPFI